MVVCLTDYIQSPPAGNRAYQGSNKDLRLVFKHVDLQHSLNTVFAVKCQQVPGPLFSNKDGEWIFSAFQEQRRERSPLRDQSCDAARVEKYAARLFENSDPGAYMVTK